MATFNLATLLGIVLLAASIAQRRSSSSFAGSVAALLVATVPSFWAWTASGLETVPFVLAQVALWWFVTEGNLEAEVEAWKIALPCAALILLRADGFVYAGLGIGFLALRGRESLAVRSGGIAATVLASHVLWRRAYYGDWLPNTYYAKVTGPVLERLEIGLGQLVDVSAEHVLWLPLLAVAWDAIAWLRDGATREDVPFPLVFTIGVLGYWIWVGGDHFEERFLLLFYVFGAVILAWKVTQLDILWCGAVALTLVALQLLPWTWNLRYDYRFERYDGWITLGKYLGVRYPGRLLALGAAGKVPFFSDLETIDMRGLNDRHIARLPGEAFTSPGHDKQDLSYVLSRDPDLLAAWVRPNLDMALGLSRRVYTTAGYRLVLLVNSTRSPRSENVVDVVGMARPEIRRLVRKGYRFGVLRKVSRWVHG